MCRRLYRVRQNKISQRENRDIYIMKEYFYTKFSTLIRHITYVFISLFNFTQLTEYLVKWRSIKINVRFSLINSLKYLTFSSVRAVFGRPQPGFRYVADPRSTRLQIAFTEQSFQPFSGNSATIVWYPKPSFRSVSIRALSLYDILPITKVVIGLTAIIT